MKKTLLILVFIVICFSSMASSVENFSQRDKENVSLGDIVPLRFKGSTLKEMRSDARHQLGRCSFVAGAHSGQFLNSSYGKMCEKGLIKPRLGFSIGANFYSVFPFIISAEYSAYKDQFGEVTNHNKSFAGFVSLATFPWFSAR